MGGVDGVLAQEEWLVSLCELRESVGGMLVWVFFSEPCVILDLFRNYSVLSRHIQDPV